MGFILWFLLLLIYDLHINEKIVILFTPETKATEKFDQTATTFIFSVFLILLPLLFTTLPNTTTTTTTTNNNNNNMSANLGKCKVCNRTVYRLEGVTVGPPGKVDAYHKICFKCSNEGCTWQLTVSNYKYCDGRVYCKNHEPMKGFSNKDHLHGTFDVGSKTIASQMNAQKGIDRKMNEQVRGAQCPSCKAPAKGGKFCGHCGTKLFTEQLG